MTKAAPKKRPYVAKWAAEIREAEWKTYQAVIDAAAAARIPFALGGAFGLAVYTRIWRNTKDLDLYCLPHHRNRMIDVVSRSGLTDYYDQNPYDRGWIYRATADGVIVDVIWAMANRRAQVDEWWMSGPEVEIRGRTVRVARPEAILWDKLYIMQRGRCDWPDIFNLLYAESGNLDWTEVLKRLKSDTALLAGALGVFRWISPGIASTLPQWLWERVNTVPRENHPLRKVDRQRARLLDRRPWYAQTAARQRTA